MHQTDQARNRIVVAGICGSLRRGSYTRMAVNLALQGAEEVGAQTYLIDLTEAAYLEGDAMTTDPGAVAVLAAWGLAGYAVAARRFG